MSADSAEGRRSSTTVASHAALLFAAVAFSVWNVLAEALPQGLGHSVILCVIRDGTAFVTLVCASVACRLLQGTGARAWFHDLPPAAGGVGPASCRDRGLLAVVGLSGPFAATLGTVLCAEWAGADEVGILNALTPALASLLAVFAGFERPTASLFAAVACGSAGGLLAVQGGKQASSADSGQDARNIVAGTIAGIVMALSQALFLVAMKPLLKGSCSRAAWSSSAVMRRAYGVAFTMSALCLVVLLASRGSSSVFGAWRWRDTALALYAGFVCGAINYSLIAWANRSLAVSICALYGALQPPVTAVIAFFFRGESLSALGFASMALVILSLAIVSRMPPRGPEASSAGAEGLLPTS